MATDAGREVFALPGSIHNPMSRGCHRLIRQGVSLAETPEEVIEALAPLAGSLAEALRCRLRVSNPNAPATRAETSQHAFAAPSAEERLLLESLGHDPVNLDQLAQRTGLTVGPLSAMLLAMELDGKISAEHGRYSRRP
jgi:DNA processing protein